MEGSGFIPVKVIGTLAQANGILGAALTLIATYKAAREAWKDAHPAAAPAGSPFLDDAALIDLLAKDGQALADHAAAVLAKHLAPAPEAPAAADEPSQG